MAIPNPNEEAQYDNTSSPEPGWDTSQAARAGLRRRGATAGRCQRGDAPRRRSG